MFPPKVLQRAVYEHGKLRALPEAAKDLHTRRRFCGWVAEACRIGAVHAPCISRRTNLALCDSHDCQRVAFQNAREDKAAPKSFATRDGFHHTWQRPARGSVLRFEVTCCFARLVETADANGRHSVMPGIGPSFGVCLWSCHIS